MGRRWHLGGRKRIAAAACAVAVTLVTAIPAAGAGGAGIAWTLAGTGAAADTGDGGQAREAAINQPRSIFPTPDGGFVWAEPFTHRVRKVGPDGVITTIAGTGVAGYNGDGGAATAAQLNLPHTAVPTADGGYLVADTLNNRIRRIAASGTITTVAGNGGKGYGGDGGPATAAFLNNPRGVALFPDGSILIPDTENYRVRKVSPDGVITTVAGTGVAVFAGDGGPATSANINKPFGVAVTADGGFLVIDIGNVRIRKVGPDGIIRTVAGTGVQGFSGDGGPATAAQLAAPHNVAALPDGGFLIADASNERVRQVAPDGTITTLIGNGARGYTGDGGGAASAQISVPKAVGVTAAGDVLIAEEQNNIIRFVGTIVAPASVRAPAIVGTIGVGRSVSANAGGWSGTGPVIAYQWQRCTPGCADVSGATSSTFAITAADNGKAIRVGVTATNPTGAATAYSPQARIGAPVAAVNVTIVVRKGRVVGGLRRVTAVKGQVVRFNVRADRPGTLHLHGYGVSKRVVAGKTTTLQLVAGKTGTFVLELHGPKLKLADLTVRT